MLLNFDIISSRAVCTRRHRIRLSVRFALQRGARKGLAPYPRVARLNLNVIAVPPGGYFG